MIHLTAITRIMPMSGNPDPGSKNLILPGQGDGPGDGAFLTAEAGAARASQAQKTMHSHLPYSSHSLSFESRGMSS